MKRPSRKPGMVVGFRSCRISPVCLTGLICLTGAGPAADPPADRPAAVRSLMEISRTMADVPFREIVLAATGRQVLAVDRNAVPDLALLEHLTQACQALLVWLNGPEHPAQSLRRINEASRLVEDRLRLLLHSGDFTCTHPATIAGKSQRSGYPDLQLTHRPSGRITYLDPKLFEATSRNSSLRTFYYEPNELTGKIGHDARHLLMGISHDGKDGAWTFSNWELIDLFDFRFRLKVEFQGSNKDLYQEKLLLRRSGPQHGTGGFLTPPPSPAGPATD